MTIATSFEQVTNNSPDGAQMGQSAAEKIAFFGGTPVVQPTSADQGTVAATAAAAALTASSTGALTATNPSAPSNYDGVTNLTEPPTKAETETISAALDTLEDDTTAIEIIVSAIVVDDAAQKVVIDQNVVDIAAQKVETDKLITDVGNLITLSNQLRSDLVTLTLIKGS